MAAPPAASAPGGSLVVTGKVHTPRTFTAMDLAQGLPQHDQNVTDGGVFAFGDAPFLGSMGETKLAQPVVDAAATPSGGGYWLLAADGGVFALGNAMFHGRDAAGVKPAVKLVPSAAGAGYRIVHTDATVTSFGQLPALSKTSAPGKVVTATA